MKRNLKNEINSSSGIIHFGNFGFNTQVKSFVFVQNILPFISKNLKNRTLLFFITRSFKKCDNIIVQLSHTAELINKKYTEIKLYKLAKFKIQKLKPIKIIILFVLEATYQIRIINLC